MRNIYTLDKRNIFGLIPKDVPGIYYLGEKSGNEFCALYVGRSDDLRRRLLQHARSRQYSFFKFRMRTNDRSACRNELLEYSSLKNLHNKIHLSIIRGIKDCPVYSTGNEIKMIFNKSGGN